MSTEIIGPSVEDREPREQIHGIRLAGGAPLYYAFLENPEAVVISPQQVQEAKRLLSIAIESSPEEVKALRDVEIGEARRVLDSIIQKSMAEAA